jgi:dGTPase
MLGDVGERFLERRQPGLEAQVANIADAIAYNNHDVDDGIRAGLLSVEKLREQVLFDVQFEEVRRLHPDIEDRRLVYEIIRRMINRVVTDLIDTTQATLDDLQPESIDDVRAHDRAMVSFSEVVRNEHVALKAFLMKNLYKHPQVQEMTDSARRMVSMLFQSYLSDPSQMPAEFSVAALSGDESARARVVSDYVAGMTDRFAIAEHERLC